MDNKNVERNVNPSASQGGKKEEFTRKLGDKMERLGEKIYRKGDEIEHSRDSKK